MATLVRPDNPEPPPRVPCLHSRPGTNQPIETFYRVNTAKIEHDPIDLTRHDRIWRFGQFDPVRNHRNRVAQAEIPHLLVFLVARRVQACSAPYYGSLKQSPEYLFFYTGEFERRRVQHAARPNDEWSSPKCCRPSSLQVWQEPQTVIMDHIHI